MGIFPILFKQHVLIVGETYLLTGATRIVEAKLIRSTERGFNFFDVQRNKNIFKKHLYPREVNREGRALTFLLPKDIIIQKKPADDQGENNNNA